MHTITVYLITIGVLVAFLALSYLPHIIVATQKKLFKVSSDCAPNFHELSPTRSEDHPESSEAQEEKLHPPKETSSF